MSQTQFTNSVTAGILTSGLTPLFIRSMRTGPRHWRARGHREITWSFTKVFFKFPKCFVSRLFQFFFLVLWISNGCLWWYLWVDSASCMIKRFVVAFIITAIMCRHLPLQLFHDLMNLMDCLASFTRTITVLLFVYGFQGYLRSWKVKARNLRLILRMTICWDCKFRVRTPQQWIRNCFVLYRRFTLSIRNGTS